MTAIRLTWDEAIELVRPQVQADHVLTDVVGGKVCSCGKKFVAGNHWDGMRRFQMVLMAEGRAKRHLSLMLTKAAEKAEIASWK